ncbi:MAG TPA: 30S ribosome-binding factor RbfA [Hyphomonas sp.]|nr:30S ribosome-binding factor RbfA [Hyphomonas sp.]
MARKPATPGLPSQRQLRAGELIRHALTDILSREAFRDPALESVLITVGEVRCSPDLKHANIFVSPLGDDSEEGRTKLATALNRAAAFLRGRLGREIELRYTPELHFIADKSYDDATAIDRLLMDPRVRRDVEGE